MVEINVPARIRKLIYIANICITPIIALLVEQEIIPTLVGTIWSIEIAAAMLLAGINVGKK